MLSQLPARESNGSGWAAHAMLTDTIVGVVTLVTMATMLMTVSLMQLVSEVEVW